MTDYSTEISEAYHAVAAVFPGFVARPEQLRLSTSLVRTLTGDGGHVLVSEAPTGTGKTLAYLIGGTVAVRHTALPLVVATATVALQEQVMNHDIPMLVAAGLLDDKSVVLMKGRGRYFCNNLAKSVKARAHAGQYDFFDETSGVKDRGEAIVEDMVSKFAASLWDGDLDTWQHEKPAMWEEVCANPQSCLNKSCEHHAACKYFRDRARAPFASIVVTNHALVLADLEIRHSTPGAQVLPLTEFMLVFDEGHHLPEKAVDAAKHELDLARTRATLAQAQDWKATATVHEDVLAAIVDKAKVGFEEGFDVADLTSKVTALESVVARLGISPGGFHRFSNGVPANIITALVNIKSRADLMKQVANAMTTAYSNLINAYRKDKKFKALQDVTVEYSKAHPHIRLALDIAGASTGLLESGYPVVWAYAAPHGLGMACQPLEGAQVLDPWLWDKKISVAIVSATLRTLGTYQRYGDKSGLPFNRTAYETIPPVLPYKDSTLRVVEMINAPDADGFYPEVIQRLGQLIRQDEGTLVVFTSVAAMKDCVAQLSPEIRSKVLMQGAQSNHALLKQHKQRIDAGRGSVLVGVDTFSEGLDLPGNYCTHVIMIKLPFACPATPVEEARQEDAGPEYFEKCMLPDASIKLVQTIGRLVRRSTDLGLITILDNRLLYKPYGRQLLDDIPPFKKGAYRPGLARTFALPSR